MRPSISYAAHHNTSAITGGPLDVRSNLLASAIVNCPWFRENDGLLWDSHPNTTGFDRTMLVRGLRPPPITPVARSETCDGQLSRMDLKAEGTDR